ncbi:MAG: hypothetical protein ABEJ98_03210 [Candidatus Nanohaloarchaea archaeon]
MNAGTGGSKLYAEFLVSPVLGGENLEDLNPKLAYRELLLSNASKGDEVAGTGI